MVAVETWLPRSKIRRFELSDSEITLTSREKAVGVLGESEVRCRLYQDESM